MSTGDFKCPYCYNYNCRDSLGRNCKDRENNPLYLDPINLDPNISYPNIPPYQIIKSAESWQCLGCKRHYAPHVNHCDCQISGGSITQVTWGSNNTSELDKPQ